MANDDICVCQAQETGNTKVIKFSWTSDTTDGSVDLDFEMDGLLQRMVTFPATGADQPDDNYDISILAVGKGALGDNQDVLYGDGGDRDDTARETAWPRDTVELTQTDATNYTLMFWPVPVHGLHTFRVRNAGNGLSGEAWLYLTEGNLHQG